MKKRNFTVCMWFVALVAAAACSKSDTPTTSEAAKKAAPVLAAQQAVKAPGLAGVPAAGAAAAAAAAPADPGAEAKEIFAQRCTLCHGATGLGDGAGAANLNPKPRNLTDKAWQASVKDDYLTKIILNGGMSVGKSPLMPGNPDLMNKPETVAELVKIVRGFGK